MRENKFVLPIILLLLIIFLPSAIYGTIRHNSTSNKKVVHEHKENGVLYYYDDNNNLVGSYKCVTNECDDAKSEIDDKNFNFETGDNDYIGVFGGSYVLVKDENVVKLYNLKLEKTIKNFVKMKNYDTKIAGRFIILQDDVNNYGLFDLETVTFTIPLENEFIGVSGRFLNSELDKLRVSVKDEEGYYITDYLGEKLSSVFSESIFDYDDRYIVVNADNESYKIYDYEHNEHLTNMMIVKHFDKVGNVYIITNNLGDVRIYKDSLDAEYEEFKANGATLDVQKNNDVINILDGNGQTVGSYNLTDTNNDNENQSSEG